MRLFMESNRANLTNQSAKSSYDETQLQKGSGISGCSTLSVISGNGIHSKVTKPMPRLRNSSVRKDAVPCLPRSSVSKTSKRCMTTRRHRQVSSNGVQLYSNYTVLHGLYLYLVFELSCLLLRSLFFSTTCRKLGPTFCQPKTGVQCTRWKLPLSLGKIEIICFDYKANLR